MKSYDADASCPICHARANGKSIAARHPAKDGGLTYHLNKCEPCELEFWTPLKMIPEFYANEQFAVYKDYHSGSRPFPPWAAPFFVHGTFAKGRLLDVGCGDGAFLSKAREAGFDVYGIDIDINSVRIAEVKFQLRNVSVSSIYEYVKVLKNTPFFDVVCFFEVLEHQDDPMRFLSAARSLLNNGGYIAGSVPNRDRFLAWLDRRFDTGDLPPHHFLWFSAGALKKLLMRSGFESIFIFPSGNIPYSSLRQKLAILFAKRFGSRNRIGAVASSVLAVPIAAALWIGYRLRPQHIYFHAKLKSS